MLVFCCIIGAGFVSGSEIFEFFSRFGNYYYFGIIAFFIVSFTVICRILDNNSDKKRKNLDNKLNTFSMSINTFVISGAMFSGLKNLIENTFDGNKLIILFCIILIFAIFISGIKWLSKIDFLVFIFIFFMIFVFVSDFGEKIFNFKSVLGNNNQNKINWNFMIKSICFAVIYIFMNFFQIRPLVEESGIKLNFKSKITFAFTMSLVMSVILFVFSKVEIIGNMMTKTMPFLDYFTIKGGILFAIFLPGLALALITTLISSMIGLRGIICKKTNINYVYSTLLVMIITTILGLIKFDFYVFYLYPILGIFNGFFFIFC